MHRARGRARAACGHRLLRRPRVGGHLRARDRAGGPRFGHRGPALTVVDQGGKGYEAELAGLWDDEPTDLALLRVREPCDHLCVLLDPNFRDRDQIDVFGYPQKYPGGVPATFEIEGQLGAPEWWLKVKGGQVQPGMSGAAVVDQRTGAVCAVLKRSRDARTDLGGYGIPIQTLFQVAPQLEGENARFHAKDTRWEDLLPADVRRLRRAMQATRTAEPAPEKLMVITIGETASGWEVAADVHPDGEQLGPVPIDLNIVRQQVARLFRDWASRGRMQQQGGEVALLGGILFRAVFPGAIGDRFAELRERETRVAIALRFDGDADLDLVHLPWEHAYFEDARGRGVYLARETGTTFARAFARAPAVADVPRHRTLRVVVVGVRPQWEQAAAQTLAEVDQIVDNLREVADRVGVLDVRPMDEDAPDLLAVSEAIGDADVVHYVGFGRFAGGADELALGGDSEFGVEYVPLKELAMSFDGRSPRLVVLQLVSGRPTEIPADFSVLARALMEQAPQIMAVIASQYPTSARVASKFNETLYENLARGTSVDAAVQEARLKLTGRVAVSPALFLRSPGELRLTAPGRDVVERRPAGAFASHA